METEGDKGGWQERWGSVIHRDHDGMTNHGRARRMRWKPKGKVRNTKDTFRERSHARFQEKKVLK